VEIEDKARRARAVKAPGSATRKRTRGDDHDDVETEEAPATKKVQTPGMSHLIPLHSSI
jgi:hypothetical protein